MLHITLLYLYYCFVTLEAQATTSCPLPPTDPYRLEGTTIITNYNYDYTIIMTIILIIMSVMTIIMIILILLSLSVLLLHDISYH